MSFSDPFNTAFTESQAASSILVPHRYDLAINGRPYMVDELLVDEFFRRTSIELTAGQQDSSTEPGESSLSRDDLWRRTSGDWSKGAGQVNFDKEDSDRRRFRASRGVNVWERWELTLLPDTEQLRASANTNLKILPVGSRYYIADGQEVRFATTLSSPTFTDSDIHAGQGVVTVQDLTSDGFTVWAALGSSGIHTTERDSSTSAHFNDLAATVVGYVKGRLMAAAGASVYNVTASGAAPSALFTQANPDFTWVGFAEGRSAIYMAGFSGDKSLIYGTAVLPDGTALDAPTVVAQLPDGEIVRSIQGYLGRFLVIGTDQGLRFAQVVDDSSIGEVILGGLLPLPGTVRCLEPQDRFVWFGWERHDLTHSGLGRVDLSILNDTIPAYASDLMVESQADVLSVATFDEKRVFAVSGLGFYTESDNLVDTGFLDTGFVSYDLYDRKTAATIGVRHTTTAGSYRVEMATDEGSFTPVAVHQSGVVLAEQFALFHTTAERFEFRIRLDRDGTDPTLGPSIRGWTLRAKPFPRRNEVLAIPIRLFEHMVDREGGDITVDPDVELATFKSLVQSPAVVTLQLGQESLRATVKDYIWMAHARTNNLKSWNGSVVVSMSTVE